MKKFLFLRKTIFFAKKWPILAIISRKKDVPPSFIWYSTVMMKEEFKEAVQILDKDASAGILPLSEQIIKDLQAKPPESKPLHLEMILEGAVKNVNSVIYDSITSETIMKAFIKTKGAAGPSFYDEDDYLFVMGCPSNDCRQFAFVVASFQWSMP